MCGTVDTHQAVFAVIFQDIFRTINITPGLAAVGIIAVRIITKIADRMGVGEVILQNCVNSIACGCV
ncbi:MAG: hypothetical protein JEZ06_21710 [Anaerolineaceae bacterium]|nr:hypothetical protein [Anaerolineaceae bacterium]